MESATLQYVGEGLAILLAGGGVALHKLGYLQIGKNSPADTNVTAADSPPTCPDLDCRRALYGLQRDFAHVRELFARQGKAMEKLAVSLGRKIESMDEKLDRVTTDLAFIKGVLESHDITHGKRNTGF